MPKVVCSLVRTGSTVQALKSICEQAGATFVGVGAIIHNRLLENCMNGFQMETLAQAAGDFRTKSLRTCGTTYTGVEKHWVQHGATVTPALLDTHAH